MFHYAAARRQYYRHAHHIEAFTTRITEGSPIFAHPWKAIWHEMLQPAQARRTAAIHAAAAACLSPRDITFTAIF